MKETFIYLEGLLTEAGQFELGRTLETRKVDPELRDQNAQNFGDQMAELTLMTAQGAPLVTSYCAVNFPTGCSRDTPFAGAGLVRAAIAHHPDARQIALCFRGATLYQGRVGRRRPASCVKRFKSDTKSASFDLEMHKSSQVSIWADLPDGRRLRAPATRAKSGRWMIDLSTLSGLGHAVLVAQVTRRFRTTELECGTVKLGKAVVSGHIIEPAEGAAVALGHRISLMGVLFDQNGRRIDWCSRTYSWRMNGAVPKDGDRQIAGWSTDKPGQYRLELIANPQSKTPRVLARTTFEVKTMTAGQAELIALLKARSVRT